MKNRITCIKLAIYLLRNNYTGGAVLPTEYTDIEATV